MEFCTVLCIVPNSLPVVPTGQCPGKGKAVHRIELDWRASAGVDANTGGLTLWIDSVQKGNITSLNNDTHRIDRVQLGAVVGIDTGTRGIYYFDAFEFGRVAYIGP